MEMIGRAIERGAKIADPSRRDTFRAVAKFLRSTPPTRL